MPKILTIAAMRLLDPSGRILLVRKRNTVMFMQPGGKLEVGEDPHDAVIREIEEELGLQLPPGQVHFLDQWRGPAANESNTDIHAYLYTATTALTPVAQAEIEEILWQDPVAALQRNDIAPLLRHHVLPQLVAGPGIQ
ncbi:NTP pyrophosphohydrolase [Arthrobacter sp. MYb227]|uniref:NUDIX hydrolase n=1 Tax=Arthrobacter sp. MYb227 TaxID=1848601 RepID=UPI000CFC8196|nr:NUDIX domain-containing protein [Arthrobacter sp. MYb227]PQZ88155.1 NTP pyrophosphohydrolase [Arthrobacter sp. MYb227]